MSERVTEVLAETQQLFFEGEAVKLVTALVEALVEFPGNLALKSRLFEWLLTYQPRAEAIEMFKEAILRLSDRGQLMPAVALYRGLTAIPELRLRSSSQEMQTLLYAFLERWKSSQANTENDGSSAISLFVSLSLDELVDFVNRMELIRLPANTVITREGEEGSTLFLISGGSVHISCTTAGGERLSLARLGSGQSFGEWSIMAGDYRRHAWAVTEEETELLELSGAAITYASERHPRIRQVLSEQYAQRRLDTLLARVFPSLSLEDRKRLASQIDRERTYESGEVLFSEGDKGGYLALIQRGIVEVFTFTFDGARLRLALLGPGQYVGEGAALTGSLRNASAVARTQVVVYNIPRAAMIELMEVHPEVKLAMEGVRMVRVEDTNERLSDV